MTTAPATARGPRRLAPGASRRRQRRRPAAATRTASCARSRIGEDHRHLLHLDERRISASARRAGRCARGDAEFRPPGERTVWLEGFALPDERVGRVPDPDRAGVPPAQQRDRRRSSPSTRARRARPSPSSSSRPGTRCARPTRCSSDLEPDAEALIVNRTADRAPATRSSRPTSATGSSASSRRRWEGITGGRGDRRGRRAASSTACARRRRCRERSTRARARGAGTEPAFAVLGAEPVAHAATPTLRFHLHVERPARARGPHDRALDADPDRPGAARLRRRDAGAAGRAVRAARALGARRRSSFQWAQRRRARPGFTGATSFALEVPCTYDLEVAAAKYFYSLPGRRGPADVPLQRHGALPRRGDRLQVALVPWSCSARWRMPVDAWKRSMAAYYPGGGWVRLQTRDARRARGAQGRRGLPLLRRAGRGAAAMSVAARRARRHAAVRGLRALPVHAGRDEERDADAVRHRLPAGLRGGQPAHVRPRSSCSASRRGRRVQRDGALPGGAAASATRVERRGATGAGRVRRPSRCAGGRGWRRRTSRGLVRVTVARRTTRRRSPTGLDRTEALARSLLSTHVVVRCATGGRFMSPLAARGGGHGGHDLRERQHLPGAGHARRRRGPGRGDRPARPSRRSRPESRGNLFDSTEIEEALLLHVLALSDGERARDRRRRTRRSGR